MKKITALLLALLMLLSMVACSGKTTDTTTPADSTPATSDTTETTDTKTDDAKTEDTSDASTGELRTVKFCLTRTAEVLEDTPFWVAQNLGYAAEEGLDIEMIETIGTTDCKMVATGQADFAVPGPSLILQSIEEGLPIKVVCAYDAINIWGLCVLKDAPFQSFEDIVDAQEK